MAQDPLFEIEPECQFRLEPAFLRQYEGVAPRFGYGALSAATYYRTYANEVVDKASGKARLERPAESIARTIEGAWTYLRWHCHHEGRYFDTTRAQRFAQRMFDLAWRGLWSPAGRGLSNAGTNRVERKGGAQLNNCAFVSTRDMGTGAWRPFTQIMDLLMLGCGVGFDTLGHSAPVRHAGMRDRLGQFNIVSDSREGWCQALEETIAAFTESFGQLPTFVFDRIRERGSKLSTGGYAPGPQPLKDLIQDVIKVLSRCAERGVWGRDGIVDVANLTGRCVVTGNKRRSSEIALGDWRDSDFLELKNRALYPDEIDGWRWASNNSVLADEDIDFKVCGEMTAENGEPGYVWLDRMRSHGRLGDPPTYADRLVAGVNPCFHGATRLATDQGLIPIHELALAGRPLKVLADTRVAHGYAVDLRSRGTATRDAAPAFMTAPSADVFALSTEEGYEVTATGYHKMVTPEGFRELRDLRVGDRVLVQSGEGLFGTQGGEDLGAVLGWTEGDGCISGDAAVLWFYGKKQVLAPDYLARALRLIAGINDRYPLSARTDQARGRTGIVSQRLSRVLATNGYTASSKGRVPEVIWRGTRACVVGYLRSLFAADGQVNISGHEHSNTLSIRLGSISSSLLRDVQVLLLNLGIASRLYLERSPAGTKEMPDGRGGTREYACRSFHELAVAKENAVRFADVVGLERPEHASRFREWAAGRTREPYRETFVARIKSIEPAGSVPVYCTTQPTHHTVVANGLVTGQCGEIPLEHMELCNLAFTFPTRCRSLSEWKASLRAAYLYSKAVSLVPTHDEEINAVVRRNRRIGVGMAGIAEQYERDGARTCVAWWDDGYRTLREMDSDYSEWLGIARSVKLTTVAPGGTVPLLWGVEGGMRWPSSEHYFRLVRMDDSSPLPARLAATGLRVEPDRVAPNTSVVYFPVHNPNVRRSTRDVSLWEKANLLALLQRHWADNSVSNTLEFHKGGERDERADIARVLEAHASDFKSVSFLPHDDHGYEQAPYTPCTAAEYTAAMAATTLDLDEFTNATIDVSAKESEEKFCDGFACEIRPTGDAA